MNKAIFLDRDGVINQTIFRDGKARAPYTMEDFKLFEGVKEAITTFKAHGFLTIIVTNQPDVARGWVSLEAVHMINRMILDLVPIDAIKICFHTEKDHCICRKPSPGMLLEAAREWEIDFSQSFMIGDRLSDIEAGKRAGCQSVLIGDGYQELSLIKPDSQFLSLLEASQWIISNF
jgi:D-glycero-D-manno-heptose 1,7-bisphosphate phosphatase